MSEQIVDLTLLFRILLRRFFQICAIFVLFTILGYFLTHLLQKQYTTKAVLTIEEITTRSTEVARNENAITTDTDIYRVAHRRTNRSQPNGLILFAEVAV